MKKVIIFMLALSLFGVSSNAYEYRLRCNTSDPNIKCLTPQLQWDTFVCPSGYTAFGSITERGSSGRVAFVPEVKCDDPTLACCVKRGITECPEPSICSDGNLSTSGYIKIDTSSCSIEGRTGTCWVPLGIPKSTCMPVPSPCDSTPKCPENHICRYTKTISAWAWQCKLDTALICKDNGPSCLTPGYPSRSCETGNCSPGYFKWEWSSCDDKTKTCCQLESLANGCLDPAQCLPESMGKNCPDGYVKAQKHPNWWRWFRGNIKCPDDQYGKKYVCCVPFDSTKPRDAFYNGPIIDSLEKVLGPVVKILYYGGLFIGVFFIIFSGYKLMVSQGNPQQTQDAQEQLTAAIVGIIFILLSVTILRIILGRVIGVTI